MCLIIYKPKNVELNLNHIKTAMLFNDDGIGISIRNDKQELSVFRGVEYDDLVDNADYLNSFEVVVHLRYGTSGRNTVEQMHPFLIGKKTKTADYVLKNDERILFHNGVMFSPKGNFSDTQIMARGLKELSALDKYTKGNRFLIQSNDENIFLGEWSEVEGMLYSNLSYHVEYERDYTLSSWDDFKKYESFDYNDLTDYDLHELCPFCDSDNTELIDIESMNYGCYDCDNIFVSDEFLDDYNNVYAFERYELDDDELLDETINGNVATTMRR